MLNSLHLVPPLGREAQQCTVLGSLPLYWQVLAEAWGTVYIQWLTDELGEKNLGTLSSAPPLLSREGKYQVPLGRPHSSFTLWRSSGHRQSAWFLHLGSPGVSGQHAVSSIEKKRVTAQKSKNIIRKFLMSLFVVSSLHSWSQTGNIVATRCSYTTHNNFLKGEDVNSHHQAKNYFLKDAFHRSPYTGLTFITLKA